MKDVRKVVFTYLKSLFPRVYFQVAPEDAEYPYLIYDISIYPDGQGFELVNLDVDGWDMNINNDTMRVEDLMEALKELDKKVLTTDYMSVVFYLENKMALLDEDKTIKRRKNIYQGRLMRREIL